MARGIVLWGIARNLVISVCIIELQSPSFFKVSAIFHFNEFMHCHCKFIIEFL